MRRQFLLASAGVIALTGTAFAADLSSQAPPPVFLPAPPPFTYTGLYVGGQVGYAWDNDSANVFVPAAGLLTGPISPFSFGVPFSLQPDGVIGGAHIGYNLQIGQWLLGLEGTVDGTSLSGSTSIFTPVGWAAATSSENVQGSIRLRAGYVWNRLLIYATGGAAFTGITNNYSAVSTSGFGLSSSISQTRAGWTVGGGLEYAVTNNWSLRVEYRYSDFGHYEDYPFAGISDTLYVVGSGHHLTENQVQAGFSYKLDLFPQPAPVVAKY
ncbi:MAG TPA: outer membrane protein [Methylocella sp.]|nr:outer membrane protein [Methylocella sp.]